MTDHIGEMITEIEEIKMMIEGVTEIVKTETGEIETEGTGIKETGEELDGEKIEKEKRTAQWADNLINPLWRTRISSTEEVFLLQINK